MIHLPVEQGSEEWHKARLGIPTSSEFTRIVTPKGALSGSTTRYRYACELIAERMLGHPVNDYVSDWMLRGQDLEDRAVAYYELQRDIDTQRGGFCKIDAALMHKSEFYSVGCSPDRLVGDDGGLEIKCPSETIHVATLLGLEDVLVKHRLQVQGSLWITGRKWWDFLSYHPELPPALMRIERDEEFIGTLSKHVRAFCVSLEELYARATA